ncbi:MAG: hypothetical protein OEW70_04880 [candidate division WOR-3 bacterium]|nr:hypothetical protein [candidate division WOR-3 bacterium]
MPIKYQKLLCLLLPVICSQVLAFGQWQTYTNANFIYDITAIQNKLYCATKGGLTIFDKETQAVIQVLTNTDGLPQNQCLCIAKDDSNNLWIGTDGAGLVIFEPQNQIFQSYRSSQFPTIIKCILISSDTILVGSDNGFYVINTRGTFNLPDDDQIIHFIKSTHPELMSDNILSFGATDYFWIGTNRGLVSLNRDLDTLNSYSRPFGDSVKAMTVISDTLFIATERGIARFNGTGFEPVLNLATPVQDLAFHLNSFYLAADDGLFRYSQQRIDTIWKEPTQCIITDSLLFCGMGGAKDWGFGLRVLSDTIDTLWKNFYSIGLITNNIFSLVTNNMGEIYACHNAQGLSRLSTYGYWIHLYSPLYGARVLAKDRENRIWLGHFSLAGGLSFYDPQADSWGIVQWGESNKRNIINALGIDHKDTKWVWNGFGVIVAIDASSNQIEFPNLGIAPPPGRDYGYEFSFDSKDRVWLGTTQGLLMFDYKGTLFNPGDDEKKVYTEFSGLPSPEIVSVAVDTKDRIWVGTANGAAVLDNEKVSIINTQNSQILSNDIKKVRVDNWGIVWFLTARGLCRYDPHTRRWTNYTQSNSQVIPNPDPMSLTNFYTSLYIDDVHRFLLVGTQAGLSRLNFESIYEPTFSSIRVFPNPCIKGIHEGVTFDSLPSNSKILIYSLSGTLLTELLVNQEYHQAFFNAQDYPSGIYLGLILSPAGKRVEKFAIIR